MRASLIEAWRWTRFCLLVLAVLSALVGAFVGTALLTGAMVWE